MDRAFRVRGQRALKSLFRRHPWLVSALAVAIALALFFAVRFTAGVVYWSLHHQEPVRAWMTVRYIGKSWELNPRVVSTTAGLPDPVRGHPVTLAEIAQQRGVPVEDVIADVEVAIARLQAGRQ